MGFQFNEKYDPRVRPIPSGHTKIYKCKQGKHARSFSKIRIPHEVNMASSVSSEPSQIKDKPVCIVVLGMAGSGKTTFVQKLAQLKFKEKAPYLINLDPACREVPYPVHIGMY